MVLTPVAATDVDKNIATNRSCTALDFLFSVSSLTFSFEKSTVMSISIKQCLEKIQLHKVFLVLVFG